MTHFPESPAMPSRRLFHRVLMGGGSLLTAGLALAGCAPQQVFDRLVRVEPGGALAASDLAYGDHPRQRYDVYAPVQARQAPVAVFLYGGSWSSGAKGDYSFVGRTLAARGFVTVIPDYRLVPEVAFPDFVTDGAKALAHARANIAPYGGDARRLYLFGHSAGAYNAAMLAVTPRHLTQAGLNRSAIRAVAGLAGPYDFYPFDVASTVNAFGDYPRPLETQPVRVADAGTPPMLLLHGRDDTTVYPRNSERLAERLRALGRPVETKFYDGLGHIGIITALTRTFGKQAPVTNDLVDFFNRYGAGAERAAG